MRKKEENTNNNIKEDMQIKSKEQHLNLQPNQS